MSRIAIFAPCLARPSAMALPKPWPPPVTRAVRPSRLNRPWSDMTNCFKIAPSDRCRLSPAACRIHHLPSCQFVLNPSHIAPFGCHRPEETKCFCVVILEIMSGAAGDENYVACLDLMGLIIDDHGSATGEDVIELLQPRMAVRMPAGARTDEEESCRILLGSTAFVRYHDAVPHGAIGRFDQRYIIRAKDDLRFSCH